MLEVIHHLCERVGLFRLWYIIIAWSLPRPVVLNGRELQDSIRQLACFTEVDEELYQSKAMGHVTNNDGVETQRLSNILRFSVPNCCTAEGMVFSLPTGENIDTRFHSLDMLKLG